MPLFDSWLSETKELQNQYYDQNLPILWDEKLIEFIRWNTLAAEDELHEALNEVSWKPWASAQFINREEFIGELVDALHFIGNMLAGVGCSDEELSEAYEEKMARNRARMTEGYTGLEKCSICKRSKDDVIAHGGTMISDGDFAMICNRCFKG